MKLRLYNVTIVANVALEVGLGEEEAAKNAREAAYDLLRDDFYAFVMDADVEATDKYEEED